MEILAPYTNLKHAVWCQEEPMNQGAWYSSQHHMRRILTRHNKALVPNTPVATLPPRQPVATLRCTPSSRKNCCRMLSLSNAFAHLKPNLRKH